MRGKKCMCKKFANSGFIKNKKKESPSKRMRVIFFHTHSTVILSRAFKADTISNNMRTKYLISQRSYCKCSVQNLRVVLI